MEPMENIRLVLAARMKSRRNALRLNQDQLAEKAKLSSGMIRNVEIGKRWPSPATLEAIANGLGCTPGELLNEEPVPVVIEFPVSHAIKKIMNVPDGVYELAVSLGAEHGVWEGVKGLLQGAINEQEKESKSRSHSS